MTDILNDLQLSLPGENPLTDRAAAEILRLRQRVTALLQSNNHFEQCARDERRRRAESETKYQHLRRLVLIEAAEHCETYGLSEVAPELFGRELRMKARG